MTAKVIKLERCGFAEPGDDVANECRRMGLRITVREPFLGRLMSIVRCHLHSDWIESRESVLEQRKKL